MKKRNFDFLKQVLIRLLIIFVVAGGLFLYLRTGFFTIQSYQFVGVPDKYMPELIEQTRAISERKLFYILPGNRVISYHKKDIKELVNKILPNTAYVKSYPYGLHTLRIVVTPHIPLFRIDDTHAITEKGIIYTEHEFISELPKLEIASSTNVTTTTLQMLTKLIPQINAVLYPITKITIDEYDDIRLYDDKMKHAIIILSEADTDKVWSNIISAVDTEPLKSKLEKNKDNLEYLDTRFGNKVFYKFTNTNHTAIIPSYVATTTSSTTLPR